MAIYGRALGDDTQPIPVFRPCPVCGDLDPNHLTEEESRENEQ